MKGYVQVYTGDGKGKTTAALGLALRAFGAGLNVYMAQFVKGRQYSELESLKKLSEHFIVKQYGRGCFINNAPTEEDFQAAKGALKEIRKIMLSGEYRIIILDEVNIATHYGLITVEELIEFILDKPEDVELVLTGRHADPRVMELADLVTEMKAIKHYYQKGIQAREGIEK
jgi:cob(I)alamin adenosyltransferase